MLNVKETSLHCPDCQTPLYRFRTVEGDDLTGCPDCGLGTWSDAPDPQNSLLPELLPETLRVATPGIAANHGRRPARTGRARG